MVATTFDVGYFCGRAQLTSIYSRSIAKYYPARATELPSQVDTESSQADGYSEFELRVYSGLLLLMVFYATLGYKPKLHKKLFLRS
jgi:hypothetical protein